MIFLRRPFLALLCAASLAAVPPGVAAATSTAFDGVRFLVERGGSPMGTHTIRFTEEGDRLTVDIAIDLKVDFGPITVFRYSHRNREVWEGGRLISIETTTDDDGTPYEVRGEATENGFVVTGAEGKLMLPAGIVPTSYWNPATLAQSELLDTQRGRIVKVETTETGTDSIAIDGAEVPSDRYRMTGDLKLELWYTAEDELAKIAFDARGQKVEYKVVTMDRPLMQEVAQR